MIALVDYDNLRVGGRDIWAIVQQLLDEVGVPRCEGERAVRFRLYGGWFEGLHLSRRAQRLSAAIDSRFPRRMSVVSGELAVALMVTVELARRLVDDRIDLTHTYRRWSTPPTLSCLAAPFEACARPAQCALSGLAPFVNNAQCPVPACGVTPPAVLKKEEQKLVDSMLVVDLVHLAETRSEPIVLASSDDDMWPGASTPDPAGAVRVRGRNSPVVAVRLGGRCADPGSGPRRPTVSLPFISPRGQRRGRGKQTAEPTRRVATPFRASGPDPTATRRQRVPWPRRSSPKRG